jgi:hypothetical protein
VNTVFFSINQVTLSNKTPVPHVEDLVINTIYISIVAFGGMQPGIE